MADLTPANRRRVLHMTRAQTTAIVRKYRDWVERRGATWNPFEVREAFWFGQADTPEERERRTEFDRWLDGQLREIFQ